MSLGKWKIGSRKHSTASSGNSDTTSSSSSSSTTRTSASANKRSSGTGGDSNRSSKTSSSSTQFSPSFSWFRSGNRSKRKSIISRDDPAFARLHKPFTPQNLEHQKLLSSFEWNWDDQNCSSSNKRRRISLSLSPCATRNTTVDECAHGYGCDYGCDYGPEEQHGHDHGPFLPPNARRDTLSGPLARLSMRDGSCVGLDQENTT